MYGNDKKIILGLCGLPARGKVLFFLLDKLNINYRRISRESLQDISIG